MNNKKDTNPAPSARPASATAPVKPSMYSNRVNTPAARHVVTAVPKDPVSKKLKIPNVEDKLVSFILDEIIDSGPSVKFNDIGRREMWIKQFVGC